MNLNDIVETFFVESFEGLEILESGLLNLESGPTNTYLINDIFRAAHSIKGGGGTFGFTEISDFMHGVETLLDELRNGYRSITPDLLVLLLDAVDCTRNMLTAAQNKQPLDQARITALEARIKTAQTTQSDQASAGIETNSNPNHRQWQILFRPYPNMLVGGNDPLRIFRELAELGQLQTTAYVDALPNFDTLNPKENYLYWELTLDGDTNREAIAQAFEWVEDECDLEIIACSNETDETNQEQPINTDSPVTSQTPKSLDSIRVSTEKIDDLINLVGELVITQSMLSRFDNNMDEKNLQNLQTGLRRLIRNTRELQENVLQIRMLPIRFSFNRFPRLVHDISQKLNKQVKLKLTGEDTELDKTVLERISDPLVHLVRNSLDHGIEMPETRIAANKPETATLELKAFHEGGNIIIEVIDDGAGLNTEKIYSKAKEKGLINDNEKLSIEQINNLIFQPGFSTANEISDLSGRGVGMDVVKRNIKDLGGDVWLQSTQGTGTKTTIKLPLTLAILDGQLIQVGTEIYIIPLISIIETLQLTDSRVNHLPNKTQLYRLRNEHIPIISLRETFNVPSSNHEHEDGLLVIVDSERQRFGILVDELLDQQQVVIKSLDANFKQVTGLSGATILGDGTVALILDVQGIVYEFNHQHSLNYKRFAVA